MSRPVTMNDLFGDPEGCESTDDKTAKLASKAAGFERKGGSRVHIAKAAVQGEFGARSSSSPDARARVQQPCSEGLQIRRPQGGVRDGEEPKKRGWGEI